jgi:N-carbamoylputrescine amidase
MGIDCSDPATTWGVLQEIPAVDLLLLPELALVPWLCADRRVDAQAWDAAAADQFPEKLNSLGARVVVGTLARSGEDGRFNDAFCWTQATGVQIVHTKTYLPDEPGFWEASWYRRGQVRFDAFDTPVGRVGVSVCTEMWFTQHVYPDVDLVLVPRATPIETTDKWLAGASTHAVTSGAFCLSSNRAESLPSVTMGATGWAYDPEGTLLGVTASDDPVLIVDLDLAQARTAKSTYPRYVSTH